MFCMIEAFVTMSSQGVSMTLQQVHLKVKKVRLIMQTEFMNLSVFLFMLFTVVFKYSRHVVFLVFT